MRLGSSRPTLTGESARNTRGAIQRLFGYARPYAVQLISVAVLVILSTISNLAGPILLGIAIDRFIGTNNLAVLLHQRGDRLEATRVLEAGLKIDPNSVKIRQFLQRLRQ